MTASAGRQPARAWAGAACELGLVDELRIFRCPVVIGGGTPYLPPVAGDVDLGLVETREFGQGEIFERYRVMTPPLRGKSDTDVRVSLIESGGRHGCGG